MGQLPKELRHLRSSAGHERAAWAYRTSGEHGFLYLFLTLVALYTWYTFCCDFSVYRYILKESITTVVGVKSP